MSRLLTSQLTLHKLDVLCAVGDQLSITQAATRLNLSQPVVTAHIRALEEKLGVRILARQGRNIVLTQEGQRAYEWAKAVTTQTRELEREFSGSGKIGGRVALAASLTVGSYVMPKVLADLHAENPDLELSLKVVPPRECVEAIEAGECDAAVTLLDPRQNMDNLNVERLWDEPLLLVAGEDFSRCSDQIILDDLEEMPFVAAEQGTWRRDLEEASLRPHEIVRRNVQMEIGHAEGMKEAVINNIGVAFLFAASVRREMAWGLIRTISVPGLALSAPVYMIAKRGKLFSGPQMEVLRFLKKRFDNVLPD